MLKDGNIFCVTIFTKLRGGGVNPVSPIVDGINCLGVETVP